MTDVGSDRMGAGQSRLIPAGIGLGALFWLLESAVEVFVFHEGRFIDRVFSPQSHEIWMRLIVAGMFVAFAVYAQAIVNSRRRAEEATGRANAELDQIFETAADGMRVVDRNFNVLRVNETFATMSGTGASEAVGKKCYDIFRGPLCHTPDCPLTQILGGKEHVECDVAKERNDGVTMPCIVTATPFREPGGQLIGIV
ncbi:MAG: PAS domain-containing protein, partial [Pseudomonadota bacterium]